MRPHAHPIPRPLDRRRLLAAALASAGLAACGDGGGGPLTEKLERIYRQQLLTKAARRGTSAGLVSTSLRYADTEDSALAVDGVRQKGVATPTENSDWMRIGSASKSMTACMAAALVQRGQLSWTLSLAEALPEFAAGMRTEFRTVTVEQLLGHRGGLIALNNDTDVGLFAQYLAAQTVPLPDTVAGRKAFLAAWVLAQEQPGVVPGRDFQYSNADFFLVGLIMEARTGRSYPSLFDELVARPVGAGLSLGVPTSAGDRRQRGHIGARGSVGVFEGNSPDFQVWQDVLSEASGGGFATLEGYGNWQRLHQDALRGQTTALPAGYVQRLAAVRDGYALGWEIGALPDSFKQRICLFHSGIVEGFSCYSVIAQDGGFAIAACTNTEGRGEDADWVVRELITAIVAMQTDWR